MTAKLRGGEPMVKIVETREDSFCVFPTAGIMFDMVMEARRGEATDYGFSERDDAPRILCQVGVDVKGMELMLESRDRAQRLIASANSDESVIKIKGDIERSIYLIEGDHATFVFRFEADNAMQAKLQERYGYQGVEGDTKAVCFRREGWKMGRENAQFFAAYDPRGFVDMTLQHYPVSHEVSAMMRLRREASEMERVASKTPAPAYLKDKR